MNEKEIKIEIRDLGFEDLFSLTRIIKKMGIRNELKGLSKDITGLKKEEKALAMQDLQMNLVFIFVENIGNAEREIYKLFADLTGMTVEDVKKLKPKYIIEIFKKLFSQEDLGDFLNIALK